MRVAVVGAGLAGAACAAALRGAGIDVDVLEGDGATGGRLASPELHGRRVDLGAAYFTAEDDAFREVVARWACAGVARQWTDTLDAVDGHAPNPLTARQPRRGPMRWAAPQGLRSLVRETLRTADLTAQLRRPVEHLAELPHDVVVLAMPDPQAARLLGDPIEWVGYEPVIAVAAGWDRRHWPPTTAVFVNGDPDVTLVADDGERRGDGAPVLVVHTTPERARQHLDAPEDAVPPAVAAARRVLGIEAGPDWTHAHRWTFAKPAGTHGAAPYALLDHQGRRVGVCGDSWCPGGSPRVESAWLSGTRLGRHLTDQLTSR